MELPDFTGARLLIAGDLMLDRYWSGAAGRISPEAPVPVVRVEAEETRAGGAGNVALNAAGLGTGVDLIGIAGTDREADLLEAHLDSAGVQGHLIRQESVPTLVKLRVLARHQQLVRLDFEEDLAGCDLKALKARFGELLAGADGVVLSDYAKGTLANAGALIESARAAGCPVLVDPKGADFARYRGATVLTPNRAELEAVVGPWASDAELEERADRVRSELGLEALIVTRGGEGMSIVRTGAAPVHLPARAREVFDVTGAGDTVVATLAAARACGESWEASARFANLAAGEVVGRLGAATIRPQDLRRARARITSSRAGLDEEEAVRLAEEARAREERLVMTNGCFDLLHAGHVACLEEAASLGDRLMVAVNDDDSVRRLKGEGRPINPLEQRMAVLAGLAAVDWVVPFAEDDPARLVERILPDVLAKGGDYRPEDVAGYEAVTGAGGEVRVLPFREGCSSSGILEAIRAGPGR